MFVPAARLSALGLALGLLLATAHRTPAEDKKTDDKNIDLQIGGPAPKFELRTDADTTWSAGDHYGKKWLVTY